MNYEKALEVATEAHKGQKRWNGDDYITHPIRVASKFEGDTMKSVAVLHDVIEDTPLSGLDLLHHGISVTIIANVEVLTKLHDESYADYILRVKRDGGQACTLIKIEDLKDNLRDLPKGQRRDKYELALKILEE